MNKFKVGQRVKIKVTGKEGKILGIKEDVDINHYGSTNLNYYVSFENNNSIIKRFFTVHDLEEEEEDILDEKEKEYLSNIIKPFRYRVENIEKFDYGFDMESIVIYIKDFAIINLPNFKKNTMYQNMKLDKKYTLEELGL